MINNSAAFYEFVDDTVRIWSDTYGPNVWRIRLNRYNKLRWYAHCAKVYRSAPRKLRKCEIRKMDRRRQCERKRYI
jgi:hypothetical protein